MRLAIILLFSLNAVAQWQPLTTHTTESLRGLMVVDQNVVWASGTHGTYLFTTNGGETWTVGKVPGAEDLDFRGVVAFGSEAYLMSSGTGDKARIYRTRHFGDHWDLQFTNREPKGFFDSMAFSDRLHGMVVGDPVNGKIQVLLTSNGGATWQYSDPRKMPPAVGVEGSFAASNTCIATIGRKNIWFITGGPVARVFRSTDGGKSWQVSQTPMIHGEDSTGGFSIAFRDAQHGVVVGGDYKHPDRVGANLATTDDGGKTWKLVPIAQQSFFSAVAYVSKDSLLVAGPIASAFSKDGFRSWEFFSSTGFNAVSLKQGSGVVYAAGDRGSIAKTKLEN